MNNIPRDLSLIIFLELDPKYVPHAAKVCKKWYEEIKKISTVFCEMHQLDVTNPVKTFCNYRTWASKPSLLSTSTYDNTVLKIFGLCLGELYNWNLDENLNSEQWKILVKEIGTQKSLRHIFHNDKVAIPEEQVIRIFDLSNHQCEVIKIPSHTVDLIYHFNKHAILFRNTEKNIIKFNRSTRECVEFIMPFMNNFSLHETKNFLIFWLRNGAPYLHIMSKGNRETQQLDCSLTLFTASNSEDLFAAYTKGDGNIKIYQDEGEALKILHCLNFPQLKSTLRESCFLKFYRDCLFIHQGKTLLIINPRTGTLIAQLDDIPGNSQLAFSNNRMTTRNVSDSHQITCWQYEFNGKK